MNRFPSLPWRSCGQGLVALALAACAVQAGAAGVTNPGFETGSTSGWTVWTNQPSSVYVNNNANSGTYGLTLWNAGAYQTDVSQTVTGLANGQYTVSAMFLNGGGQAETYLYAKNCGGSARTTSIPVSSGWNKVVVRGVQVTGGQCTIGLWSNAGAGQWVAMDNVTLVHGGNAYSTLQGGDISQLDYLESLGAKFYDGGVQKDAVQILADNGFNFVRLRAYNDPGNPGFNPSNQMPPGYQTTADILRLAQRAWAKGMKIQLTLNYSDWWADGCQQDVPHQWTSMTFPQIQTALSNYTKDIVQQLVNQGTPPEMVSLGNQMQCGLLLNPGNYGPVGTWTDLAALLNTGYAAVKAASPNTKVMLHIDSPYDAQWFFDGIVRNRVKYDVIGLSWYPYWEKAQGHTTTDTLPELLTMLNAIANRYGKDIFIMETGLNWNHLRSDGWTGQLLDNGNVPYAESPEGQRDYLYDLMNVCKSVDNGRCLGLSYWDPIAVNQAGFGWIVGGLNNMQNYTLFDYSHNSLPGLTKAFKNNR